MEWKFKNLIQRAYKSLLMLEIIPVQVVTKQGMSALSLVIQFLSKFMVSVLLFDHQYIFLYVFTQYNIA